MRSRTDCHKSKSPTRCDEGEIRECNLGGGKGSLALVSLGPGSPDYMIPEAKNALESSDVIVGYKTYINLVKPFFPTKEFVVKGMKQEVERCRFSIEKALKGCSVALISSGDVGVYGMAGLVLEICAQEHINIYPEGENISSSFTLKIIPGVSALNAVSSLLGAPIMHDFASISLSDHLTPWEAIEKRLRLACQGDFVIVLYNPRSSTRPALLEKTVNIMLEYKASNTPCGIVWNATREGQKRLVTSLGDMPFEDINMHATVIIGNSQTYVWNHWMITPRGYRAAGRF